MSPELERHDGVRTPPFFSKLRGGAADYEVRRKDHTTPMYTFD